MKHHFYAALLIVSALFAGKSLSAQTHTAIAPYDTIEATPDSLFYQFATLPDGAYGNVTFVVYFEGDFGASSEFIRFYGENNTLIGQTQPYFDGSDCMVDSAFLTVPAAIFNTWAANDTVNIYGVSSSAVDFFCTTNHARVKLTYDYCLSGIFAVLSTTQTEFCPLDQPVTLVTSPSGGTLTGQGLSGNQFDPGSVNPDTSYTVTYSFTDGDGCTSEASLLMTIGFAPAVQPVDTICPGSTVQLVSTSGGTVVWFSDQAMTSPVDTGTTVTSPVVNANTSFYASNVLFDKYFMMTSITDMDSAVVDHDLLSGDDRGGIAVTQNYIYIIGDDSTARFDLDLQNGTSFPLRRDGMFSDLADGQLYSLYNATNGFPDAAFIDSLYVTEIRTLNDDLSDGGTSIVLSDSIPFGWDNNYNYESGIFAGHGFLLIYSSPSQSWYVIDINSGEVLKIGEMATPLFYYSESFSVWGIGEFDGNDYSVIYRNDNDQNLHRHSIIAGTDSVFATFSDLSDLASLTYAPWNNRWYFHFEGGSQFNGLSETLAYADATDSTGSDRTLIIGCPNAVEVNVGCVGIDEENAITLSAYPNPNNGQFVIAASVAAKTWNITVTSVTGATVYGGTMTEGQYTKNIDLSFASDGIYFVTLQNETARQTIKVIVQH